jgi:hypothetical protein
MVPPHLDNGEKFMVPGVYWQKKTASLSTMQAAAS